MTQHEWGGYRAPFESDRWPLWQKAMVAVMVISFALGVWVALAISLGIGAEW